MQILEKVFYCAPFTLQMTEIINNQMLILDVQEKIYNSSLKYERRGLGRSTRQFCFNF